MRARAVAICDRHIHREQHFLSVVPDLALAEKTRRRADPPVNNLLFLAYQHSNGWTDWIAHRAENSEVSHGI